jgi:hypothetical protein
MPNTSSFILHLHILYPNYILHITGCLKVRVNSISQNNENKTKQKDKCTHEEFSENGLN